MTTSTNPTTARTATSPNIILFDTRTDIYYHISGNVLKPLNRQIALSRIANTSAMLTSGALATFAVQAVV